MTVISPPNVLEAITCEVKPGGSIQGRAKTPSLRRAAIERRADKSGGHASLCPPYNCLDAIAAALWPEPVNP
jgi:hypothetical protein